MTGWDTRAQAGLRPPRAISTNINPTHGVAGHYGGSGPFKRQDHDACRAIWRAWQDFHMSPSNANNYNDIAYCLGVCHHDIVLEGRSTRTRPIVRGGANGNATVNGNRYSVVVIWGANDGEWPDGLKRAWRFARDWLRDQDSRTGAGLTPHSAMSSTSCPGGPGREFLAAGAPYPSGSPTNGDSMSWNETLEPTATAAKRFPDGYTRRAGKVLMHVLGLAYQGCYGKIAPNSWMKARWPDMPEKGYSPRTYWRSGYGHSRQAKEEAIANGKQLGKLAGEVAGLRNAVEQLAGNAGQPVDMAAVQSAALAGAQAAMAELSITVTVEPAEEPDGSEPDPVDGTDA